MKKEVLKEPNKKSAKAYVLSWIGAAIFLSVVVCLVPFSSYKSEGAKLIFAYIESVLLWVGIIGNIVAGIITGVKGKRFSLANEKKIVSFLPFKNYESLVTAIVLVIDIIVSAILIACDVNIKAISYAEIVVFILSINMLFAFCSKAYRYIKHK